MIKKRTIITAAYVFMTLAAPALFANTHNKGKQEVSKGIQHFGQETVEAIHTDGAVTLDGTHVIGLIQVNGSLKADGAQMGKIDMSGQSKIKNSVVEDEAIVNGSFDAENCTFKRGISVSALNPILRNCKVDSVYVRKVFGTNIPQVLELEAGTKITGDVVFESRNGKIVMTRDCEIKGNVLGAAISEK